MKKLFVLLLTLITALSFTACKKPAMNADLKEKESFETYTVAADLESKVNTTFQTEEAYRNTIALPTDSVMVFGLRYQDLVNNVKSWLNKGYEKVNVMLPMGRDNDAYYIEGDFDGVKHRDIIQLSSGGAPKTHPTASPGRTTYYVCPDEGFAKYAATFAMRALNAGAADVFFEEPDFFVGSGYSEAFKKAYEEYYGETWVSGAASDTDRLKTDAVMAKIYVKAYELAAEYIKYGIPDAQESYIRNGFPDAKVYICTHSTSNYLLQGISADNFAITDLENIDGLVAQAWSDTSLAAKFFLNGSNGVHAFEYSYLEYSELVNYTRLNGKEVFTLADPMSDSAGNSEQLLKSVYKENIAAQLINPDITRFEVMPWPKRAFEDVSFDYKGLQETVIKLENGCRGTEAVSYAGTRGIGVVTSYTNLANGHKDVQRTEATNNLTGVAATLVSRGIPVEVLSLEGLKDKNYLNGIHTLILSYDSIKPENKKFNEVIAQFVQGGGSLIYTGGYNKMQEAESWWKEYGSPQNHLFNLLGLGSLKSSVLAENGSLSPAVESNYLASVYIDDTEVVNAYSVGKQVTPIYKMNGSTVAFEQKAGKGNVIVSGLRGSYYSSTEESYKILESLVIRALSVQGKSYRAPQMMRTVRGNLEIVKTFDREYEMTGSFIDLFDEDYAVVTNPKVGKNSYALYCRLSGSGLEFSNGIAKDFLKSGNTITFNAQNVINGKAQILVHKGAETVKSVKLLGAAGESDERLTAEYREEGEYLYITYKQANIYPASSPNMNGKSYQIQVSVQLN